MSQNHEIVPQLRLALESALAEAEKLQPPRLRQTWLDRLLGRDPHAKINVRNSDLFRLLSDIRQAKSLASKLRTRASKPRG